MRIFLKSEIESICQSFNMLLGAAMQAGSGAVYSTHNGQTKTRKVKT